MNSEVASLEASSESWLPCATMPVHVAGQSMPAPGATTAPAPEPPRPTVTGYRATSTVVAASTVTTQVGAEPAQPLLQPAKTAPTSGAAVSVTTAPRGNTALPLLCSRSAALRGARCRTGTALPEPDRRSFRRNPDWAPTANTEF